MLKDRIKVSTETTGQGSLTLGSAYTGYQDFSALGSGNIKTYYAITSGADWETGEGTYNSSAGTLSRDLVFESSNGGNLIPASGTSTVFVTYPASASVYLNSSSSPSSGQYLYYDSSNGYDLRYILASDIENATSGTYIRTGNAYLDGTVQYNLTTTETTVVDISNPTTLKYLIKAEYNGDTQIVECLAVSKDSTVYITMYGLLYTSTNPLINISAKMYLGYINLEAQAVTANTTVKIFKTII